MSSVAAEIFPATPELQSIPRHQFTKWDVASILAILFGIALRFIGIGDQSFWFDEGLEAWMIRLSPAQILRMCRADVAAPLHFILLRYWMMLFGNSESALRGFSAVLSSIALVLFYLLARRILNRPVATCIATWLFAISIFQIQYAQEARFYTLLSLLCLIGLYAVHRHLMRPSLGWGAVIVLSSVAALYTHNAALFYIAALDAFWLLAPARSSVAKRLRDVSILNAIIAVAYLPWVPTLIEQSRWAAAHFWASTPHRFDFTLVLSVVMGAKPYQLGTLLSQFMWIPPWTADAIAGGVSALAVLAMLLAIIPRDSRRMAFALCLYLGLPIVAVYLLSKVSTPIFIERIFIASTLTAPLALCIPLVRRGPTVVKILQGALVAFFLATSAAATYAYQKFEHKEDWRGAYNYVTSMPRDATLLVFCANEGELPFNYYEWREQPPKPRFDRTGTPGDFFDIDPPRTVRRVLSDADLDPLRRVVESGKYKHIVLVYSHDFSDPQFRTLAYLDENCGFVEMKQVHSVAVYRFDVIHQ